MSKSLLSSDELSQYNLLSFRLDSVTNQLARFHELKKMKEALMETFLMSPEYSFNVKTMLCLNNQWLTSAVCWGFENFSGERLDTLVRQKFIRRDTVTAASNNGNFTWSMVEFLLLSKNRKVSGHNMNIFLQKLNEDVWTKEFITEFVRYVDGRTQVPVGQPKRHSDVPVFLDTSVVYGHARRVFDLYGYPDEWVAQIVPSHVSI